MNIKKGDLYYINPFDGGSGKGRAAVVVSADDINQVNERISVAYLSTSHSVQEGRTHVKLHSSGRPSFAILEGVTTIPKTRLGSYIGCVTQNEGAAIASALCASFGL